MFVWEIGFWICVVLVLYPYALYPLWLALLRRVCPRPVHRASGVRLSVSFVVAAYNEEENIETRLRELLELLDRSGLTGEILVVSDGSTDDTARIVRQVGGANIHLLELSERVGKAAALSYAAAHAHHDILVFADVRQRWAPDALQRLLENFADPSVGAVSGDLVVETAPGTLAGVGLYWQYEKWLRRQESAIGSQVGVTGAIAACRRSCFRAIPDGTLLDDVYWPLQVAMQGYRVIHDSRAIAYDRLPPRPKDEFRRKVRTLAGNFQLAARLPSALLPWRNPVWFAFVSHKLARLIVPWALIGLLLCSWQSEGWFYQFALILQLLGYTLGVISLLGWSSHRLVSAAGSFVLLNAAAWVAFWVYFSGRASSSWKKVPYKQNEEKPLSDPEISWVSTLPTKLLATVGSPNTTTPIPPVLTCGHKAGDGVVNSVAGLPEVAKNPSEFLVEKTVWKFLEL